MTPRQRLIDVNSPTESLKQITTWKTSPKCIQNKNFPSNIIHKRISNFGWKLHIFFGAYFVASAAQRRSVVALRAAGYSSAAQLNGRLQRRQPMLEPPPPAAAHAPPPFTATCPADVLSGPMTFVFFAVEIKTIFLYR